MDDDDVMYWYVILYVIYLIGPEQQVLIITMYKHQSFLWWSSSLLQVIYRGGGGRGGEQTSSRRIKDQSDEGLRTTRLIKVGGRVGSHSHKFGSSFHPYSGERTSCSFTFQTVFWATMNFYVTSELTGDLNTTQVVINCLPHLNNELMIPRGGRFNQLFQQVHGNYTVFTVKW